VPPPLLETPPLAKLLENAAKVQKHLDNVPKLLDSAGFEETVIIAQVVSYVYKQLVATEILLPLKPNLLVVAAMTQDKLGELKQACIASLPSVLTKFSEFRSSIGKEDNAEDLSIVHQVLLSIQHALDFTTVDFFAVRLLLEGEM